MDNYKKRKIIHTLKKYDENIGIKALGKELMILNVPNVKENCEKLFETLEAIKDELAIVNYTVTTTSLEDVFIKLNTNEDSKNMFEDQLNLEDEVFDDSSNENVDGNKKSINLNKEEFAGDVIVVNEHRKSKIK